MNTTRWQVTLPYTDGTIRNRETVDLPSDFTIGQVRGSLAASRSWCRYGSHFFNPRVILVRDPVVTLPDVSPPARVRGDMDAVSSGLARPEKRELL